MNDEHIKLQALFEWCDHEIDEIKKWEEEHPNNNCWWQRKHQMIKVKQTIYNIMVQNIFPYDSSDIAYSKHVIFVLTQRKKQLLERIEKCDDIAVTKQLKSSFNKYKRSITKHKNYLNELLKKAGVK